ncbi:hypothetical protein C8R45DRAFT_927331 [Mycena sanguinolenta]|nr:hypothetical protein C8R45DRAFT_927331 [Mycena sanguinolenta]
MPNLLKKILSIHNNVLRLKPYPRSLKDALDMIVAAKITVNWTEIASLAKMDNQSEPTTRTFREDSHVRESSHSRETSILSTPPMSSASNGPIPERPASAMSGIEKLDGAEKREEDVSMEEAADSPSQADAVHLTDSVNPETDRKDDTEDVPSDKPVIHSANKELVDDVNEEPGNEQPVKGPVVRSAEKPVVPAIQRFIKAINNKEDEDVIASYIFSALRLQRAHIVSVDPKIDIDKYDLKIVVLDFTEPGSLTVLRFNTLKLELQINRPAVDEKNHLVGYDYPAHPVSRTYNVRTRLLVRSVLDLFWPSNNRFALEDDFSPIAMIQEAPTGAKALCMEPDPKILARYSPTADERQYFTASSSSSDSDSSSSSSDSDSSPSSSSSSDSDSSSESSESSTSFKDDKPNPVPTPALPSSPPPAADNTAEINRLTLEWLESKYSTPEYPIVLQIQDVQEAEKRIKRKVSQLCTWAGQVKGILDDQSHVPILASTGIAGNHKINRQNLGALFRRTSSWITQALKVHDFIEANEYCAAVKTFLQTDRVFGLKAFQEELCKL